MGNPHKAVVWSEENRDVVSSRLPLQQPFAISHGAYGVGRAYCHFDVSLALPDHIAKGYKSPVKLPAWGSHVNHGRSFKASSLTSSALALASRFTDSSFGTLNILLTALLNRSASVSPGMEGAGSGFVGVGYTCAKEGAEKSSRTANGDLSG